GNRPAAQPGGRGRDRQAPRARAEGRAEGAVALSAGRSGDPRAWGEPQEEPDAHSRRRFVERGRADRRTPGGEAAGGPGGHRKHPEARAEGESRPREPDALPEW